MTSAGRPLLAASRIGLVLALGLGAAVPAHAAALDIGASASNAGHVRINDGIIPSEIVVPIGSVSALTGAAGSSLADPAGVQTNDHFNQVGNPYSDPPQAYIDTAYDETALAGGDSARGFYYTESSILPDSAGTTSMAVLERTLTGTATLAFGDLTVDASADSGFEIGRRLTLTNTSTSTAYAFSITTGFDIALAASADLVGSASVAQAVYSISFISTGTVLLDIGSQVVDSVIDDMAPGTEVVEALVTSNALFDGVNYQVSASALGVGAPTAASLSASGRFAFNIQMAPGSTLLFNFYESQGTQTSYTAPTRTSVPLPGTALVLLCGLGVLAVTRAGRRRIAG